MKLYLVWNEAKTECVGFVDRNEAVYAVDGFWGGRAYQLQPSDIADFWLDRHGDEQCTITELEV